MDKWEILSEFTTKKGTDLVVCDLEEHVEQLGVKTMLACPICSTPELTVGYSDKRRRKLETDGYIGYCYRCNRTFINPRVVNTEVTEVPEFQINTTIKNFDVKKLDSEIFDGFKELDEVGLKYLQGRNPIFSPEFCKAMNIKSLPNGVAVPFYLDGNLVFYVIRFIQVKGNRRYHMPEGHKPLYIPTLVSKTKFIIVEGVFDAFACLLLYPEYTPCAVLGSKITEAQLRYLSDRYNPEEIKVFMDDTGKSEKNMKFIKFMWHAAYDISIVESDGTDPEEHLKKLLNS